MDKTFLYSLLIAIWIANINDLIRGFYIYNSILGVILWNFVGIANIYTLIKEHKNNKK